MRSLRRFARRLFSNKYVDLIVIVIVFISILLLIFESISGFIITQKTIDNLTGIIEEQKIDVIRGLENNRFAEDELSALLEKPWIIVSEINKIYEINEKSFVMLEKNLSEDNNNKENIQNQIDFLEKLKNKKMSKEQFVLKLKSEGFRFIDIERILLHIEKNDENIKDKLSTDKFKFIKLLRNRAFLEDELINNLRFSGFSQSEIDIVLNHSDRLYFNRNEINLLLNDSKLVFPITSDTKNILILIDDIIICFFIIELFLRYLSCTGYRDFIIKYWLDVIAVIPLFRVFRLSRVFLLLRLFRILSFAVIFGRHMSFFSSVIHKRWIDFFLIVIVLIFTITFGTLGLTSIEVRRHPNTDHAFWTTVFSLFSGQYTNDFPDTVIGKLTVLFTIISGMSCFAILIGTVSALMVDKFKEGFIMKKGRYDILEDHILICGWQEKTPQIIKELQTCEDYKNTSIVVISDKKNFESKDMERYNMNIDLIYLMEGDFTDPNVLRKANIDNAKIAVILPDRSASRSNRDMDARTVLTALTIEKLNPNVYSCAELMDPEYESHMKIGHVNQVILGGYFSGLIAAQAAMNENIVPFIKSTIPSDGENKFQNIPLPDSLVGQEFGVVIEEFRKKHNSLPIGVKKVSGDLIFNPQNYIMEKDDYLVGIVNRKK